MPRNTKKVIKTPSSFHASKSVAPYASRKPAAVQYKNLYLLCSDTLLGYPTIMQCNPSEEAAINARDLLASHDSYPIMGNGYSVLTVRGRYTDNDKLCVVISNSREGMSIEESYVIMPDQDPERIANNQHENAIVCMFAKRFPDKTPVTNLDKLDEEHDEKAKDAKFKEIMKTMEKTLKEDGVKILTSVFIVREFLEENKTIDELLM